MTATGTTAKLTIDANGALVLPPEFLALLRPDGEPLTLMDIEVEDGTLVVQRSSIPEEDWWAYTPEMRAHHERAMHGPSYRVSPAELEALVDAEDPQAALAALLESKRDERSE